MVILTKEYMQESGNGSSSAGQDMKCYFVDNRCIL